MTPVGIHVDPYVCSSIAYGAAFLISIFKPFRGGERIGDEDGAFVYQHKYD